MCRYIVHGSNVVDDAAYMQLGAEPDMQKTPATAIFLVL